jgi:hypothetical protein
MREIIVSTLVLLFCPPVRSQTPPADWKVVKDAKALCQIMVPPEWVPLGENKGAAVFQDSTIAIAVVTSQPGQEFKPLSAALLSTFGIPKERIFENSAKRIFYQDRISRHPEDTSAFGASVPARNGTCSCRVVVQPGIPEDVAKKIALSVSPIPAKP